MPFVCALLNLLSCLPNFYSIGQNTTGAEKELEEIPRTLGSSRLNSLFLTPAPGSCFAAFDLALCLLGSVTEPCLFRARKRPISKQLLLLDLPSIVLDSHITSNMHKTSRPTETRLALCSPGCQKLQAVYLYPRGLENMHQS